MVDTRVTLRTRSRTYHTRSNVCKIVKTPGNRRVTQKLAKVRSAATCRISGQQLHGVKTIAKGQLPKRAKTVSRPYGGNLAGGVVRTRIVRAFINEEARFAKAMAQ